MILYTLLCYALPAQTTAEIQKSFEAKQSDELYEIFQKEGFNPQKQLLQGSFSQDFPYNIIIRKEANNDSEKKLAIVFARQNFQLFLDDYIEFIRYVQSQTFPYAIDIVFTANDQNDTAENIRLQTGLMYKPEGSTTYAENLGVNENVAALIIMPGTNTAGTGVSFSLIDEIIAITPGGITSAGTTEIVSLGFFQALINSFTKSNVVYTIRGYFLSLYRLGLTAGSPLVGTWLDFDIPSVLLDMTQSNSANVFKMIYTLLDEYAFADITNTDVHYSLMNVFSHVFFVSGRLYIIFLLLFTAIVLFGFCNLSFVRGKHKHIHRKEFLKTWYLIPLIILCTGFFLFVSQTIIQKIMIEYNSFPIFAFFAKIILALLFLFLFSFLQFTVKLPITGFIYAYILSISGLINIIIFATLEITLIPFFVLQYFIIRISQRLRKLVPIMLCLILMVLPYIPFIISLNSLDYSFVAEFIIHANFGINILMACFLLPFEIMAIRIFIRLKLWAMRLKTSPIKILKQVLIIFVSIVFLCFLIIIISNYLHSTQVNSLSPNNSQISLNDSISVTASHTLYFENNVQTLEITSQYDIVRCIIEISADNPLPVFDANYPYNILEKPFTAVFDLSDYPPEPLILTFTTQAMQKSTCTGTAWIQTDEGIKQVLFTYDADTTNE